MTTWVVIMPDIVVEIPAFFISMYVLLKIVALPEISPTHLSSLNPPEGNQQFSRCLSLLFGRLNISKHSNRHYEAELPVSSNSLPPLLSLNLLVPLGSPHNQHHKWSRSNDSGSSACALSAPAAAAEHVCESKHASSLQCSNDQRFPRLARPRGPKGS